MENVPASGRNCNFTSAWSWLGSFPDVDPSKNKSRLWLNRYICTLSSSSSCSESELILPGSAAKKNKPNHVKKIPPNIYFSATLSVFPLKDLKTKGLQWNEVYHSDWVKTNTWIKFLLNDESAIDQDLIDLINSTIFFLYFYSETWQRCIVGDVNVLNVSGCRCALWCQTAHVCNVI